MTRLQAVEVLGLYAQAMGKASKPRVKRVAPEVLLETMGVRLDHGG